MSHAHPNRPLRPGHSVLLICAATSTFCFCGSVRSDDDINDLLQNATPVTTAPASAQPPVPLDFPTTARSTAPADARQATVLLSNGLKLQGPLWSTIDTPLRLWVDEDKRYHDIEFSLVKRIDVHVLKEGMEDDWRWLKEGSDQKIYSGKKYPNVELAYRITLLNDQVVEGGVVAPIYLFDGTRARTLALYKKYKGPLDTTLKDLVYIRSIELALPVATAESTRTTHLPLLPE